jgi:hypothetical protein
MPKEAKRLHADGLATVLQSLERSARGALPPERCARVVEHAITARRPRPARLSHPTHAFGRRGMRESRPRRSGQ